ncbi:MAG: hypothetical protein SGPRY_015069 [Prymnesium sp.]
MGARPSWLSQADYRSDGRLEVIVCSEDGEVRGYLPAGEELAGMANGESEMEEDMLRELNQRKQVRSVGMVMGCIRFFLSTSHPAMTFGLLVQELMFELRQYEEQSKKQSRGERSAGLVPPDTKLTTSLVTSRHLAALPTCPFSIKDACLYLTLQSSNEARIKAAVVFGERVFEGESLVVHERDPTGQLRVPLRPPKVKQPAQFPFLDKAS